jgi:transcriptional regulator with XRE-family HTH domain
MFDKGKLIGARLRALRLKAKLSTREVAEQSAQLAQQWGNQELKISPSWLARVEREQHELTASKLAALAHIYRVPAQELLRWSHAGKAGNFGVTVSQDSQDNLQGQQASNPRREPAARHRLKKSQFSLYRILSPRARVRFSSQFARVLLRTQQSSRGRFLSAVVMVLRNSVRRLPKS